MNKKLRGIASWLIAMVLFITGCTARVSSESTSSSSESTSPTTESAAATTEEEAAFEPFIRIDRDDANAYDRELENLRFITGDMYEFKEVDDKYAIPKDYVPNETGLSTLDVSASAQFNGWQFQKLADELRNVANGKEIYIIDLRRESHALMSDRPFSFYGYHNWSNLELSAEEIMESEDQSFGSSVGTTIVAHPKEDDVAGGAYEFDIKDYMSEKQLVENSGLHYVRIPSQDLCWPAPESVDQFIDLIRRVGIDNLWMHIHCHAGKGRTGSFLVMYDKMKTQTSP